MKKQILLSFLGLIAAVSVSHATFLLDRVVAIVNQEVITWSELYKSMEADASPVVKAMSENEKNRVFKENESVFLESLINFRLQLQEARSNGIKVSDDEVKEAIEGIRKKYSMTESQFNDSLKAEGYTPDEYRKRLHEQIVLNKVVNQQIRNKVLVTEEDVDRFMKDNKDFAAGTEAFRIRQIFFKRQKDDASNAIVAERGQAAYARIMQGEDFAAIARQLSEDASREAGGDLGFIEKGSLAREFNAALAAMKPGESSRPFWTERGLHILKLEEKASPKSAAEVREEARRAISNGLFAAKYNAWIKSLREKSFIDIRL